MYIYIYACLYFVCLFVYFLTAHQHTRAMSVPHYVYSNEIINLKMNYFKLQFVKTYKNQIEKNNNSKNVDKNQFPVENSKL